MIYLQRQVNVLMVFILRHLRVMYRKNNCEEYNWPNEFECRRSIVERSVLVWEEMQSFRIIWLRFSDSETSFYSSGSS